ncbi:MAG: hypothetical protein PHN84_13800 [Desulfuromonadaceae bacterium]|nr:hypothetical protein [Desulfuromonadaceae bacterium]MDD2855037.1 hypothetical protein [Desulfuromonadaceae bacterium]
MFKSFVELMKRGCPEVKRFAYASLCIAIVALSSACAGQVGLNEKLDSSVKSFNRMLRWHEVETAGVTFIDSGINDEYQKQAEALKKRGVSVTDFRILTTKYDPEKKSAEVVAEFDYYTLPSNRIKTLSYHQNWLYRENIKSWRLQSGLPDFE